MAHDHPLSIGQVQLARKRVAIGQQYPALSGLRRCGFREGDTVNGLWINLQCRLDIGSFPHEAKFGIEFDEFTGDDITIEHVHRFDLG